MVLAPEIPLNKPEVYESKRIQLTSPILHIGSAVSKLNPFEYVQTDKRVYLPNQEALAKALHQQGRLQEYIRKIEAREDITSLLKIAFPNGWQTATTADDEPIFPRISSSLNWARQKITDLRPMIRNGFGQLYIPGSSIKGAIRTAIAYHLLKHSPQQVSDIESKLRQRMGEIKHRAKFVDDELFMDRLFTDFDLVYQGKTVNSRKGPNTDFMRAVHVSDTEPLLEEKVEVKNQKVFINLPVVAEVIISSHFQDGKAKYRASIYAEMVRNVKTNFTISLDKNMLSWFHREGRQIPFKTVDDLLKICQEFAQEQWDYEHDYWEGITTNLNAQGKNLDFSEICAIYEPTKCPHNLRLGWGSGMTGTTVNLLLDDEFRADIRDAVGIPAPGFEAPKSRRTVVGQSGEIKFVPGWVKFKSV
ncbi:MAG: type III-A CRISPR-associated RAMP protein Csm5 [Crinalium sp.]